MRKVIPGILGLLVLMGFAGGCYFEIPGYPPPGSAYPAPGFERAVEFPLGGTLSLRNFDGYIEINGWKSERVELFAERRNHDLKIEFEKIEDRIDIKARCPNEEGKGCTTEFYIDVPESINLQDIVTRDSDVLIRDLYGNVRVQVRKGFIEVDNYSGSLTATVTEGAIKARILDLREKDQVKLLSEKGDIILYLEPGLQGKIVGFAPEGQIFNEFSSGKQESEHKLSLQVGEKGAFLSLTALHGDIRIREIKEDSSGRI
jgi:hypothetical protein